MTAPKTKIANTDGSTTATNVAKILLNGFSNKSSTTLCLPMLTVIQNKASTRTDLTDKKAIVWHGMLLLHANY